MGWTSRPKIKKYRAAGEPLTALAVVTTLLYEPKYLMVWNKPTHPTVLTNMSLATIRGYSGARAIRLAEITPEWIEADALKAEIAREEAAEAEQQTTQGKAA